MTIDVDASWLRLRSVLAGWDVLSGLAASDSRLLAEAIAGASTA